MASSSDDDFITVVCTNPKATATANREVSVTDIQSWDLPAILSCQSLKVKAHRNRLILHSSYFHGLLNGSFSESVLDCIAIEWNLETFVDVLNFIYGCELDVTFDNFLPLIEGALYFGVEMLLAKCRTWFSEVESLEVPPQIQVDDLIYIWTFGVEHACDFLPDLCASYLARNFMWAMSMNSFVDISYELLLSCVTNINLTVDSEMHLADALLIWLDAKTARVEGLRGNEDDCTGILKQIRTTLLPLWFAARMLNSRMFSEEQILKIPSSGSIHALGDGHLHDLRIRLTKFTEGKREPKIFNGPEVLNCYVGESEKTVRMLFADAEKDEKDNGDESDLHVIIFDEIDAISKKRSGSSTDCARIYDNLVNTLLTRMDGVESLNNILIIGLTNRKELLDEALLRPGRLEVQIHIGLPDRKGSLEILQIHTKKLKENSVLAPDVNLGEIATSAELEGVVRSSVSFAFNRQLSLEDLRKPVDEENIKVIMDDFLRALEEIRPACGASAEKPERCSRLYGILDKLKKWLCVPLF